MRRHLRASRTPSRPWWIRYRCRRPNSCAKCMMGPASFSTALGPEANDVHRTHLHLDLQERHSLNVCQ